MQLLYTLRPAGDDIDLGDQNDTTAYETQILLPTIRRLPISALVADTHVDDNALIQKVIVYARGSIANPPAQTRYTLAQVTLEYESGESLYLPVAMWDQNAVSTRSAESTVDPRGDDWTLANVLTLFIGGAVTAQGGVTPAPKFKLADVWVEVWGIPSAALVERKFESGVYRLTVDAAAYVASLTPAQTRQVVNSAIHSGKVLTFDALVLDNGSFSAGESYEINSSYQGMLDALAAVGGAELPEEM